MLDQMFTAENFRRAFDIENRKGIDLVGRFFPALEAYTEAIRDKVKEIRELRSGEATFKVEEFTAKISTLKSELVKLKTEKSTAIDEEMEAIILTTALRFTLNGCWQPTHKRLRNSYINWGLG